MTDDDPRQRPGAAIARGDRLPRSRAGRAYAARAGKTFGGSWWYVATDGDDVNNSCAAADAPCATLPGAIGKASSGDGIAVASGIYSIGSSVVVSKDLLITGAGAPQTILQGTGASRILELSAGVTATIEQLTVSGGVALQSGAIDVPATATLTLMDCRLWGNQATVAASTSGGGAIMAAGTLTVERCSFAGNSAPTAHGGAIYDGGSVVVEDSTFDNNSVAAQHDGGAIYVKASCNLTVRRSTFVGNSSSGGGASAEGGALALSGTYTLERSTFSGNQATYGGAMEAYGSSSGTVIDCTFDGNQASASGGGDAIDTFSSPSVSVGNSLFDANNDHTCMVGGGVLTSLGYNLVSDGTCSTWFTATGDQAGAAIALGSLRHNGGWTKTYLPGGASAALDAGNCTATEDQRGAPRPVDLATANAAGGNGCDGGAVELQSPEPSATTWYVDPAGDDSADCLSAATACATWQGAIDKTRDGDTVLVAAGTYTVGSAVVVDRNLTITGAGAADTILGGGGVTRVMTIEGAAVTISGMTVRDGNASIGGGLYVDAASVVTLADVWLFANQATTAFTGGVDGGGAILNLGSLDLERCWLELNATTSGGRGAGVFSDHAAHLVVRSSLFVTNNVNAVGGAPEGGALELRGPFAIESSTFENNGAGFGGAIQARDGSAVGTITDCTFWLNGASSGGDSLDLFNAADVTVRNSLFAPEDNDANCAVTGSTLTSAGHNLAADATCASSFTQPGDQSAVNTDPGGLRHNGGPLETVEPGSSSAARDAGYCTATQDARGFARPVDLAGAANEPTGNACDVGAVELQELVAPLDLQVVGVTMDAVALAWTDTTTDETSFEIVRTPTGTLSVPAGTIGYVDTTVSCGTDYQYTVQAKRYSELGPLSNTVEAQTLPCWPGFDNGFEETDPDWSAWQPPL